VWLVDLHSICAKQSPEAWLSPNKEIRFCLNVMRYNKKKNSLWDENNSKWRKSNNTYGLPVLAMDTKYPKQQTICAKDGLEMWFSPNDDIREC
jgi:hypothetical protein